MEVQGSDSDGRLVREGELAADDTAGLPEPALDTGKAEGEPVPSKHSHSSRIPSKLPLKLSRLLGSQQTADLSVLQQFDIYKICWEKIWYKKRN